MSQDIGCMSFGTNQTWALDRLHGRTSRNSEFLRPTIDKWFVEHRLEQASHQMPSLSHPFIEVRGITLILIVQPAQQHKVMHESRAQAIFGTVF